MRNWIIQEFKLRRKMFRDLLSAIKGQIHISFDIWTSGNSLALLGIVFHYSDGITGIQTVVSGVPRIHGPHSGENMAASACEVIFFYGITPRLGFFTLDNASTNDTAVEAIITKVRPDLRPIRRRLRCFGHVMNIVAKILLYGKASDDDKDEAEDFALQVFNTDLKALKTWRSKGPLGMFHILVDHIRKTPQRRESFKNLNVAEAGDEAITMVVQDNYTRWNSVLRSIKSGLKNKNRCQLYQLDWLSKDRPKKERLEAKDVLSPEDWL